MDSLRNSNLISSPVTREKVRVGFQRFQKVLRDLQFLLKTTILKPILVKPYSCLASLSCRILDSDVPNCQVDSFYKSTRINRRKGNT